MNPGDIAKVIASPLAFMLSKGKFHKGGVVRKSGKYQMEKNETVIPNLEPDAKSGSVSCGDTCHEQLPAVAGSEPVRHRHNMVEGGSHVTSEVRPVLPHPNDSRDAEKVKIFTRGGADRIAYPGVSDRDWNSKNEHAPNTKVK